MCSLWLARSKWETTTGALRVGGRLYTCATWLARRDYSTISPSVPAGLKGSVFKRHGAEPNALGLAVLLIPSAPVNLSACKGVQFILRDNKKWCSCATIQWCKGVHFTLQNTYKNNVVPLIKSGCERVEFSLQSEGKKNAVPIIESGCKGAEFFA